LDKHVFYTAREDKVADGDVVRVTSVDPDPVITW
jgi:hypothetical protein